MNELVKKVEEWAEERGLHIADPHKQMLKVAEEVGEISGALARNNIEDLEIEIGDGIVTLIILAKQLGMDVEECLELAYKKIEKRSGKTINGIYIKKEDL